jgi:hypothetical protein
MNLKLTRVSIWLEAISDLFDRLLDLSLSPELLRHHLFIGVQVREVNVILGNLDELVRHAWVENR